MLPEESLEIINKMQTNELIENFYPKSPEPIVHSKIDDIQDQLSDTNKELESIHYENMKLNAQIEVLNKIIDSKDDDIKELQKVNNKLKVSNAILEKSNKHSFRNGMLVTIIGGIIVTFAGWFINNGMNLIK